MVVWCPHFNTLLILARPQLLPRLCTLPAVWFWASHLTTLGLRVLINGKMKKVDLNRLWKSLQIFIKKERKGSLLALGFGGLVGLGQGWMKQERWMGGVGWGKQVDKVSGPSHTAAGHCSEMWEQNRTPNLMTFRCVGLAVWPLGNHAEAKANAPGLPRQTFRPGANPPETGTWGVPPDCIGPCAYSCPQLPTVDTAGSAQLPLLPAVPVTLSLAQPSQEGRHCPFFLTSLGPSECPAGWS